MDMTALGAIGELVGGFAVIASLVFVGLQIRQGNRLTQAETVQAHVHARNRDVLTPLNDPEFAKLFRLAVNDFSQLEKDQQIAIHCHLAKMIYMGQTQFILRRDGLIREEYAEAQDALNSALLKCPGVRDWWSQVRVNFAPDYVAYVEEGRDGSEGQPLTDYLPFFGRDPVA